jgi:hypothetical protein
LRELDDKNDLDKSAKLRICEFCSEPSTVIVTRTAERDSALEGVTKAGVLESVRSHVQTGKPIHAEYMDNGDLAYILRECAIEKIILYVKLKFSKTDGEERMVVISAHPNRRW